MKLLRIPDVALDNPNLARKHWVRIGHHMCRVYLRVGRYILIHRTKYLRNGGTT